MKRKICFITGNRADYGLLFGSMKLAQQDPDIILQIIVTGSHLVAKYGLTKEVILADGFEISAEVDCGLQSDTPIGIANSMAKVIEGMASALKQLSPDIVVILGDRYEIFAAAQAALILNIPIAHIHGGELTEGQIDEAIRHSLTKMSHIHFTTTEQHRQRVIQLGESPTLVFNFGAPGLDNILNLNLMEKDELSKSTGFILGEKNILLTFHPITLSEEICHSETEALIKALEKLDSSIHLFISLPNSDTFRDYINSAFERILNSRRNTWSFMSLGQLRYLSLMKEVDLILGNSSSGIIEAPFLEKPVVNIGIRQKGRMHSKHVIQANPETDTILKSIRLGLSSEFSSEIKGDRGIYGDGHASKRIVQALKEVNLEKILFKKFYDL